MGELLIHKSKLRSPKCDRSDAILESWLRRHPRVQLHFTPTSSSWLNLVERWFRNLTDKRICRGSFENVSALIATINDYVKQSNQNPHIFVLTASAESLLAKSAK